MRLTQMTMHVPCHMQLRMISALACMISAFVLHEVDRSEGYVQFTGRLMKANSSVCAPVEHRCCGIAEHWACRSTCTHYRRVQAFRTGVQTHGRR